MKNKFNDSLRGLAPPKTFRANGYDYVLLKFDSPFALYKQMCEGMVFGYEIHKCRYRKERITFGRTYPGGVRLAGNEDFGGYGWSFESYSGAVQRYNECLELKK